MSSNLPPGWTEPLEHDERCRVFCDWLDNSQEQPCPDHTDGHECSCEDLRWEWEENNVDALLDMLGGWL
jgi:hypothetical protein